MTQPILVVDFGAHATGAAVLTDGKIHLVSCPASGEPRWPSAVLLDGQSLLIGTSAVRRRAGQPADFVAGLRAALDTGAPVSLGVRPTTGAELLGAYLRALRTECERQHGLRVQRLVLTVPAAYVGADPRRAAMISLAEQAGFPDVELLNDAVAATMDPQVPATGPNNALALVCDLGATWSVSLVRAHGSPTAQLAQEVSGGGQDFDRLLVNELRSAMQRWLPPADADTMATEYAALDLVRQLKHHLSEAEEATGRIHPAAPVYRLTRGALERFADPALRWLLASCRAVVARAGFTMDDVGTVLVVGGGARMPAVGEVLRQLGRPVCQPHEPELAVLRGATRWAQGRAEQRRLPASLATWRVEPLSWELPDGKVRLLRWLVDEGTPYPAGAALAQVRTIDDRVFDLIGPREGILVERRISPGQFLVSESVAAMTRSAKMITGDRASKRHQLKVHGEWLLTPEHDLLVECAESGVYVRMRSIDTGAVVNELRPYHAGSRPRTGRVFVNPAGRLHLISWDDAGQFFVWDVATGEQLIHFRASARPTLVLVNEGQWRLVSEVDKKVHVGRYRRDVATMWDLSTGAVVEELVGEDLHRRYGGYEERSHSDGFAAQVHSPDGRLLAGSSVAGGKPAVWLHEADTNEELFRADLSAAGVAGGTGVQTAFSGDGHHLLARWRAPDASCVDVWKV